jgi:beta-mannosidase
MQYIKMGLILLVTLLTGCRSQEKGAALIEVSLNENWKFKATDDDEWKEAQVPGCVHTDLINNGLIEDPFFRLNEHDLQWIDKKDWEYVTSFKIDEKILKKEKIELTFHGLDTYADVYLNGVKLIETNNMFRQWYVECKDKLRSGENELRVYFHSPIKKGLEIYDNYPYKVQSSANDLAKIGKVPGEKWISPHVRKAPYHFGWDWGPRLVTSGIWEPIQLKAWNGPELRSIYTEQLELNSEDANLSTQFEISVDKATKGVLQIYIDEKEVTKKQVQLHPKENIYSVDYTLNNPQRWWPNGLGEQHLYKIKAELTTEAGTITKEQTLGLREIELIREKDSTGTSFYFKVNGHPVFMKGANVIPNDVFLDRVSPEKYEHIIKSAADCNFNMLRVWGGGIYEKDIFYDLCDQYGILVWQDFMFACNMYPGDEAFLNSVKQEAIDNVKRLRNHPSICLWCGNNEILEAWFHWGWKKRNEKKQPHGAKAMWKAYKDIFLDILPNAVKQYDSSRPYWASSPQAGDTICNTGNDGDKHDWRIWFQDVPFITYHQSPARFVSEYGFQSFPDMNTIKKYALPEDYDIHSEVMKSHQRSGIGNGTIKRYMDKYYREPKDFESFIYLGQVLQAEGIKTGIEGHRMNMPHTMGTLYWQLNDVWPVASWSSIDYYGNWKALQYFTRDAYALLMLVADTKTDELLVYAVSDKLENINATLKLELMNFEGKTLWKDVKPLNVKSNTSDIVYRKLLSDLLKGYSKKEVLLKVSLEGNDGSIFQTNKYFERVKSLNLPKSKVSYAIIPNDKGCLIEMSTDKLAKNIHLNFDGVEGWFSDNYFDLLPGETKLVRFETDVTDAKLQGKLKIQSIRDTYE